MGYLYIGTQKVVQIHINTNFFSINTIEKLIMLLWCIYYIYWPLFIILILLLLLLALITRIDLDFVHSSCWPAAAAQPAEAVRTHTSEKCLRSNLETPSLLLVQMASSPRIASSSSWPRASTLLRACATLQTTQKRCTLEKWARNPQVILLLPKLRWMLMGLMTTHLKVQML